MSAMFNIGKPGKPKHGEPTHKKRFLVTTCRGRQFSIYHSGGFIDSMEATPERININGYEVTDADLDRGWLDLDETESGEAS